MSYQDTSKDYICPYFEDHQCRSCSLLTMTYQKSLENKMLSISDFFPDSSIHPIVATSAPFAGRAKSKWAVGGCLPNVKLGFPDHNGNVLHDLRHCPQHHKRLNSLADLITEGMIKHKIPPYDIITKKGELKFITLMLGYDSHEILIRYTLRSRECLERLKKMNEDIQRIHGDCIIASATLQPIHMAKRHGDTEIFLTERRHIQETINGLTLLYGPHSFIQGSPDIKASLYQKASDIFLELKGRNVLDLYCGTGAFAMHLAKNANRVCGIEITDESISLAHRAAEINQLSNVEFRTLDADNLSRFVHEIQDFDTVVVNPPRRGLSENLINLIIDSSCTQLLYSSCNPQSLKRDIDLLASDFCLTELTPFDMFPFTPHLECLALLTRTKKESS